MQTLLSDIRYAFRMIGKSPGFAALAVLAFALGIGANTAIFSVVNAVLLRPLPYPESERLVWLAERGPEWNGGSISWPNFADWRGQQAVFEHIGGYHWNDFVLTGKGGPGQLRGGQIPAGPLSANADWQQRGNHPGLYGVARLKPGVTFEQARAAMDAIAVRLEQQYPESNKTRRVQLEGLLDNHVGNVRHGLWILLGAVGLVLLIACTNVANLLLARAAA